MRGCGYGCWRFNGRSNRVLEGCWRDALLHDDGNVAISKCAQHKLELSKWTAKLLHNQHPMLNPSNDSSNKGARRTARGNAAWFDFRVGGIAAKVCMWLHG